MQKVVSSYQMMKLVSGLSVLSLAILMSGCQPKPEEKLSPVENVETSSEKSPDPMGEIDGEQALKEIEEMSKPNIDNLKIEDKPEAWKESDPAPVTISKSLGQKIDEALTNLPPALVNVQMEVTDRGSLLRTQPKMKIQDATHFKIEYALPESKASVNSITADGKTRAKFENGKLYPLPALGQSKTRAKMNRQEIEEFAKRMPVEGFSYYANGDQPWSALVAGLQDPKNGFSVKVDEMDANPVGEKRPFYRLVAESKMGQSLKIEFVVDSKRNVPVVFRTNLKYGDGQERLMVWRADWQFGGAHEKDAFILPKDPKKS